MSSWRERILGGRDRIGWWTIPVFAMVGLAGAVLAGALAAVYYGQQVDSLEDETREARQKAEQAAEEVEDARQEALAEIDEQVASVREALTREFPFEDLAANGIVVVRAAVGAPAPAQPSGGGSPAPAAQDGGSSPGPSPSPQPAPQIRERSGTGFAVAVQDGVGFFATSFAVVADPGAPGGVVQQAEIETPAGRVPATLHSWDEGRDLALLRAEVGDVTIPLWRPSTTPLAAGERVVVAGFTPSLDPVQIAGSVAFSDVGALVTDLPEFAYLRGAPIVDSAGHVVGVFSTEYAPFGSGAPGRQASVPVQLLCERMLQECETLEAEPTEEPSG